MSKGLSRLYYQKQHKKEVFWQIWLPTGIGAVAFLTLGIMAGYSLQTGSEPVTRWAHIAVMWLILPVFVVGFASLMLLIGLNFGVIKLTQILPKYSGILLMYVDRITRGIRNSSNKSVQPVMTFRSNIAAIKHFWLALQYTLFGGYKE